MPSQAESKVFGPYEPVRRAGNYYFVSGQVGVDPASSRAEASVSAQTHQALRNMAAVLNGAGLQMSDVVNTTVYLTNMGDFGTMNAAYVEHFEAPRPARAAVGVNELPRIGGDTAIKVEIAAVAMKGGK